MECPMPQLLSWVGDINGGHFFGGGNLLGLSGMKAAAFTPACAPRRPPMPTGSTVKPELPAAGSWGVTSEPPPPPFCARVELGWGDAPSDGDRGTSSGVWGLGVSGGTGQVWGPPWCPLGRVGCSPGTPPPWSWGAVQHRTGGGNPPSLSWGGGSVEHRAFGGTPTSALGDGRTVQCRAQVRTPTSAFGGACAVLLTLGGTLQRVHGG